MWLLFKDPVPSVVCNPCLLLFSGVSGRGLRFKQKVAEWRKNTAKYTICATRE